jgi:hypothetical protein
LCEVKIGSFHPLQASGRISVERPDATSLRKQKARIPVDYCNPLLRIPARRQTAGRAR